MSPVTLSSDPIKQRTLTLWSVVRGPQAEARITPSQSPDTFTVLPAALSLQHTAVRGLPKCIVAGVPAEFTVHPADHFGNRGARGRLGELVHSPLLASIACGPVASLRCASKADRPGGN